MVLRISRCFRLLGRQPIIWFGELKYSPIEWMLRLVSADGMYSNAYGAIASDDTGRYDDDDDDDDDDERKDDSFTPDELAEPRHCKGLNASPWTLRLFKPSGSS
jgi:hypothetical protein